MLSGITHGKGTPEDPDNLTAFQQGQVEWNFRNACRKTDNGSA
jgi:hypothetical protein